MKILLSPAKSLDFENAKVFGKPSTPNFINESKYLVNKLQKLSPKKIKSLMKVSDAIADLNYGRYQSWEYPFPSFARQAGFVFTGEAYRGMEAQSMSDEQLAVLNDKLRILSGLYGLLKPLDNILPYRLEMGTSYKITPKITNLYKFWGNKITDSLNEELEKGEIVVNVASNEYNKVINPNILKGQLITCNFKEEKNGEYKTIMTFAKKARGYMTRYIVQNGIETLEGLKGFDIDNYFYNESLSSENELIFTR